MDAMTTPEARMIGDRTNSVTPTSTTTTSTSTEPEMSYDTKQSVQAELDAAALQLARLTVEYHRAKAGDPNFNRDVSFRIMCDAQIGGGGFGAHGEGRSALLCIGLEASLAAPSSLSDLRLICCPTRLAPIAQARQVASVRLPPLPETLPGWPRCPADRRSCRGTRGATGCPPCSRRLASGWLPPRHPPLPGLPPPDPSRAYAPPGGGCCSPWPAHSRDRAWPDRCRAPGRWRGGAGRRARRRGGGWPRAPWWGRPARACRHRPR